MGERARHRPRPRHSLLALDLVAAKARAGEEELEAPADPPIERRDELCAPGWPKMAFVEHGLAADPTNRWAPDHACVRAVLRSAGLEVVARPGHEIYVCRPHGLPEAVAAELASAIGHRGAC